jgi:hypothetical protein
MQVVVPSVSWAATPQARGAIITVDTPSGPGLANPVVDNRACSSAMPWRFAGTVGRAAGGLALFNASGERPPGKSGAGATPV